MSKLLSSVKAIMRQPFDGSVERSLEMGFDPSSPFRIVNIDGIGPVKAEVNRLDDAIDAGGYLLGARDTSRNIVLTVEFNPNEGQFSGIDPSTVSTLRQDLYRTLFPTNKIELHFQHALIGLVMIEGVVESAEPSIFTDKPQVTISVLCGDAYFSRYPFEYYVLTPVNVAGNNDRFMYVDNPNQVAYGAMISYVADYNTNFGFGLHNTFEEGNVSLSSPFLSGDIVEINTIKGDRFARKHRPNELNYTNLLGYLVGSLASFRLSPGRNYLWSLERSGLRSLQLKVPMLFDGM